MAKGTGKREAEPKKDDDPQFQRFLDAARKRGMNESLEDFAARFGKSAQPKERPNQ